MDIEGSSGTDHSPRLLQPVCERDSEGHKFMKLANIRGRACAVDGERLVDLNRVSGGELPDDPMAYVQPSLIERARLVLAENPNVETFTAELSDYGPPVPRPGKILAVALNFYDHAVESKREVPNEPAVFPKLTSSICGPFDPIEVPDTCTMIDYEAEVVVVVGKQMRGVAAADVWDHLVGVTAGQDISDRFEQRRPPLGQFSLAKSYDTFSPIGPVMATLDEVSDLNNIALSGHLSGQQVQHGTTERLIYSIPELVEWTCRYVTLEPGDLIFTGTPEGVGTRREPPLYLVDGMVLETYVAEVGTMRNPVRSVVGPRQDSSAEHFVAGTGAER
ncbi:fumarylacetoacetate hydrolase family protein [Rhodococcus wratislaviensis]|uniref:fumarylacetoacetate hydrolase family protein n=1 Tax=Rhodococcus wratislaviensis TaxID=44752 RepID=UPI0036601E6A